jgi:NADPH-dependent 2,4-dienoyl-CoA reductase/sulfur reductase-like enzyme/rhodanese-related sulfurtransferase
MKSKIAKKILIVGGVAGGASAAARLRRLSEEDKIIIFEKGQHVSFSNCSLPYYLGGLVSKAESLIMMSPEKFMKQYNIEARTGSEVTEIDRTNKTITVKNHTDGRLYKENYDVLILSPGARPIVPPIAGSDLVNIYTVRNVTDIVKLKEALSPNKSIAVIGGGFIGVEVAENLKLAGYPVSLIEASAQIMRTFDEDMVQILHKVLLDKDIALSLNDKVVSFESNRVVLGSGKKIPADIVVMAIGVAPEIELAKSAGLQIGATGAISVNDHCQTSDENIYAVGDAIEIKNALSHLQSKLALAWPAQVQARGVANYIHGKDFINPAYIGSSCIQLFHYNAASTGLTEGLIQALKLQIEYAVVHINPNDKVSLMPNNHPIHFKLLFEKNTGLILGAQAIGQGNVDKRIDVIAAAMKFKATVYDLTELELCYAPPFSTAKDVVNMAGYVGSNLLEKSFAQAPFSKVRQLVEENAFILDVRETVELQKGKILTSHSIPLSELRERVNEIPKDKLVYVHCRSGQRSYNAVLTLQNLGFENVKNISGGFLSVSFYEYFNDMLYKRNPIVTAYNFN